MNDDSKVGHLLFKAANARFIRQEALSGAFSVPLSGPSIPAASVSPVVVVVVIVVVVVAAVTGAGMMVSVKVGVVVMVVGGITAVGGSPLSVAG